MNEEYRSLTVTMEQGQDHRAKTATATGACLVHSGQVARRAACT
jgi:hypothetical protein